MECHRPGRDGARADYYLLLRDAETGEEMARFAEGYGLACCHVHDGVFHAFASRWGDDGSWNDVTMFKSTDLQNWEQKVVISQENEHLFNSSVCEGPEGFVMAYESNDGAYPAFTTKFAKSADLENWTKLPESTFGTDRYTACPCVQYCDGYYYVLYLERRSPRHYFETYVTRSKDLKTWKLASGNPVLVPDSIDDGINASDPEIIEIDGKTYVYYAVGDQLTWMNIKHAQFAGSMQAFFEHWFRNGGVADQGTASSR
jgi:beta-xylosidase